MQNGIPKFFKNEPKEPDPKYVLKETFEEKISEIEATLGGKALKEEIPTIPDHSIYVEKKDLESYALKKDLPEIPDLKPYDIKIVEIEKSLKEKISSKDLPDHSIYAEKKDLTAYALKQDIPDAIDTSNLVKKEQIEKFATKDQIPDLKPYALKENIPDISDLAKKSELPNLEPYLKKEDLPQPPDLTAYAKKTDLPKIPDVSDFITKNEVDEKLKTKVEENKFDEALKKKSDKTYVDTELERKANVTEVSLKASIAEVARKVSIEDMEKYKGAIDESLKSKLNKSEAYTRQEIKDRYIKKDWHEKSLESKADKSSLNEYAKKSDIEGLIDKECVDLSEYAKKSQLQDYLLKEDLPPPQDLSRFTEKSDFEKYKGEVANTYATKKELPAIPDLSVYAKKSELTQYLTKTETSYCMVKLESDFRPYDGEDWEFEFYMGNRGNWSIQSDSHKKLSKPQEYVYHTPFDGIFFIDFCFTCRRDTHFVKPHVLQRIRTGTREVVHWDYFDNSSVVIAGNDVTSKSFIKTCSLWLPANTWIKCSMQFTNRGNNHKRKTWIHAVGSGGGYSPTYFSITGTRMQ